MGDGEGRRREGEATTAVGPIEKPDRETEPLPTGADLAEVELLHRCRGLARPHHHRIGSSLGGCGRTSGIIARGSEQQRSSGGEHRASHDGILSSLSQDEKRLGATLHRDLHGNGVQRLSDHRKAGRCRRAQDPGPILRRELTLLERATIRVPPHHESRGRVELEEDPVGPGLKRCIDEPQCLVDRALVRPATSAATKHAAPGPTAREPMEKGAGLIPPDSASVA